MPRKSKGARLYLRERPDREAIWVIRDGSREVGTGASENERERAETALQDYLARKYQPDFRDGDPRRVMIADVLSLYAEQAAPHQRRADMVSGIVGKLLDFFEAKRVGEITPGLCRAYTTWRTAQRRSHYTDQSAAPLVGTASARRELETLQAAINYAYRERKLLHPVPVTLPDKSPPRPRWLTRGEAALFLRAARAQKAHHLCRLILLGFYTGTRKAALLGLRWGPSPDAGWIDLEHGMIYRKGTREQETSKRRPPAPLSARMWAHCRRWRKASPSAEHVIEFEGDAVDGVRRSWERARVAAGLGDDVTPHTLRHSFATHSMHNHVTTALAAELMGVSEAIFRATYGHHSAGPLREAVDAVHEPKKR